MPRGQEVAKKAEFGVDDKRAQYARLIAFNYGVKEGHISKDKDVNSATNAEIEKAGKALSHGNILEGPGGIEIIMSLSKKGSTTGNPLTKAYAQEVRPFLRRLQFSDSFGRRSKPRAEKPAVKKETKKAAKKSTSKKGGSASRSSKKSAVQAPAPAEAESPPADETAQEPVEVEVRSY